MTYRITPTDGLKWKVQKKGTFFWKDFGTTYFTYDFKIIDVPVFDTEKEAEKFIDERIVKDAEDEKDRTLQQLHMMTKPRIYPAP
jgi:hypothetical protein